MTDATEAAEIFRQAAGYNLEDPLVVGSLLVFPNYGQLVMTGDLHGHRRNFEKLRRFCDLEHAGVRHVMLHELIHEDAIGLAPMDTSHELFLEAARWKCDFPDQVHFLLSNHELAQVTANEITKNGRVVTKDFESGVRLSYGYETERVLSAMYEFIRSFPLAGRTPNRVFLSHSLPGPRDLPYFDSTIFSRRPTEEDLSDRGSAHMLVWGRYQTETAIETIQELVDADYFICGHQPQETGFDVLHERMVILASDHNHGVFLPLDLSKPMTLDSITRNIRPFAAIE